ncbi:MAG TPA: hypothetical protein VN924_05215 [Bryobacteraceae bacterium]|nr:hypothetical protein [Bryobacteraceae bacterium]
MLAVLGGVCARGQTYSPSISPLDGTTPTINAPGNPAGAYDLSSIEHLNMATGHLNITIPLAQLMGRGEAKETMVLPIESHWHVENQNYTYTTDGVTFYYGTAYEPINEPWNSDQPTHWNGVMVYRGLGDYCNPAPGQPNNSAWYNTLSRLTFIAPDGTEYEFRDALTGGLKEGILTGANNLSTGYDRGRLYQAWDGSSAVYTAGADVLDPPRGGCDGGGGSILSNNGTLQLRDGTTYTITLGYVTQIEDRNGNILTLPPQDAASVPITDGLGRTVTDTLTGATETIQYPVAGGNLETVTVTYNALGNMLMLSDPAGHSLTGLNTLQTAEGLFPGIDWNCNTNVPSADCTNPNNGNTLFDQNGMVQSVAYPNGQKYQFLYNSYGDVAEVILPTGGAWRYFYNTNVLSIGSPPSTGSGYVIERILTEKDVYTEQSDTAPSQVILYSNLVDGSGNAAASGNVVYSDGSIENHYSYGVDELPAPNLDGTVYNGWNSGKEYQVNYYTNSQTLLRSDYSNWGQMACTMPPTNTCSWWTSGGANPQSSYFIPAYNPRVIDKTVTIGTQQSQQNFTYDQYNNQTEEDDYDFGTSPSYGTLIRATTTAYDQSYISSYPGVYIVDLPTQRLVCTAIGTGCTTSTATAWTAYTYDETAYPPVAESSIGNHDPAYSTANVSRGNATTVSQYLNQSPLSSHYSYDIAGNVLTAWDPRLVVHSYTYPDAGVETSGTTFAFPTTVTSYTGTSGSSTAVPSSAALTASIKYDYNLGKPTQTTDVNGNITTYSYTGEPLGRLVKITRPDTGATSFTYNDTPSTEPSSELPGLVNVETVGDQTSSGDGKMKSVVFYDGLGREWETSKQAATQNIMECKTYDVRSRLQTESNPAFSTAAFGAGSGNTDTTVCGASGANYVGTSYTYDGLSRQITVTAADGSKTSYKYQGDSTSHTYQTLEIDPVSVNRLNYADAAGRLKEVDENCTSCFGGTYGIAGQATYQTTYGHDVLDDLTGVTQSGESRSFTYDSLKRLTQAMNPESGTINYTYDPSNNLLTRADADGSVLTYSAYDGMNRVTSKSYTLGTNVQTTPTVTYGYINAANQEPANCGNLLGRLYSVTAGTMVNTYCYQWAGKPAASGQTTNGTAYPMSYLYDLALEPVSFTFPSGRLQTTQYDTGGRVSSATGTYNAAPTTYGASYGYFPDGTLANVSLGPSAQIQQYCQNNRLQIVGVRLGPAGGSTQSNCGSSNDLLNLTMTYGSIGLNNGNLTQQTIAQPLNIADNFTYDAYNRIAMAKEGASPFAWSQTYNYDAYGNRWVNPASGFSLSSFTATASTNFNSKNQLVIQNSGYDNSGNQTGIGGTGSAYAFTYDAENRQYSSAINGVTTDYTYDGEGRRVQKATAGGSTMVYEYDAAGEVAAEYSTMEPPQTETLYLTPDHLGSNRLETNALGVPVWYHDYLPFGEEIPAPLRNWKLRIPANSASRNVWRCWAVALERESGSGAAVARRPPEGTRRYRGYRLSAPEWIGSQAHALLGQQRVGRSASECFADRARWNREELAGLCVGTKSLPGRLRGAAQAHVGIISGVVGGACRREHWPLSPAPRTN